METKTAPDPDGAGGDGEDILPADWRELSPEAKKVLLHKLRGWYISQGLGGPRSWRKLARPKQLPPDDAGHWLEDANGFSCGCAGPDDAWNIWLWMAGRGCGKTWSGAQWIIEQALRNPGSTWAVVAPTFRDVRVTCFEGSSGIRRQLEAGEEDQWRRNELRLDLVNGSIIYGYSADQPERLRGSNLWGAWCIAEGSLVATLRGDVPVEQVRPGDFALTRRGWRLVTASQLTKRRAPLVEVRTADGRVLRCTADHKIWSAGAWRDAQSLTPGATLLACLKDSRMALLHGGSGRGNGFSSITRAAGISALPASGSHGQSGAGTTGQFLREWTSITRIMTRQTTGLKTWNLPSFACTEQHMAASTAISLLHPVPKTALQEPALSGQTESRSSGCANSAVLSTRRYLRTQVTAAGNAVIVPDTIVSVKSSGWSDVYDLTIEDAHEFFAEGILVHNCDELGSWAYEETWYEGLIPALRIGRHPRVLVTTTPRPTRLIRDLMGRRDGTVHVTRASTWENAANLSAAALDELRRRYEGTRLGRQELEGELLEDLEGALWKRSDIDAARVRLADVPDLVRVVVGIDPAVTSGEESDETGIIVCGDDGRGHGYVLADYSMRGTPEACMREAVRAYTRHRADCIVAEVNNGGDFVGSVLRAVDPDVPYHTVRASRGKAIRAEPVSALAEQRRLHHVGSFPDLEDQLCSFSPGILNGPDDRLDALVWAVFELRGLSQASWLTAYGAQRCVKCEHAYPMTLKACSRCGEENPEEAERQARAARAIPEDAEEDRAAGGWASVYRLRRCSKGHSYSERNGGRGCPRCRSGGLDYLRQNGKPVDNRTVMQ